MNHNIAISWALEPVFPKKQPSIEYSEGRSEKFPLTIILSFESQESAFSLEETNKIIASKLQKARLGWVWYANDKWFLDLDILREVFAELRGETWLRGVVSIQPYFTNLEAPSLDNDTDNQFINVIYLFVNPDIAIQRNIYHPIPLEISDSLRAFRADHPKPRSSAFIVMRFDSGEQNELLCNTVRQALKLFNIEGLRADDKTYHDDLYWNIMTYIYGCGLGIAIYERIESESFNPNVSLEVGYMLALEKPVCLLKDKTLKALHSDLIGKLYQSFDVYKPSSSIPPALCKWLEDKGFQQEGK